MTQFSYALRMSCPNRPGIVAAIATRLFGAGFNIRDSQHFDESVNNVFYSRYVIESDRAWSLAELEAMLAPEVDKFNVTLKASDRQVRQKVVLMASKFDHCLADLLYRWKTGELEMDVAGIISNHPRETYAHLNFRTIPFHHLPVVNGDKPAQEARILQVLAGSKADLVVLARYMQILSDDLSRKLEGKCINIHHSFLPGFKGARPYHQAYDRGVKLIGATAHYVTSDLDEGPIIEQDVERISHRDTSEDLVRKGRDIERRVLARAVRSHLEDRVFVAGHRTVVFPE